ncbi:MAG: Gfo/Idh/MocA family oxidoreductase [Flavitalea sp.]
MTIHGALISRYKSHKKKRFLSQSLYQSKKQYAFIGVGMHSITNLYPVLHYFNISLKYIYTRSSSHAAEMASKFPGTTATHNIQDILDDPGIAGVFVSAQPSEHFGIVKQLLEHGKHVFVEKPPCQSLQELEILVKAAGNLNCFVNLQKKFGPLNEVLKIKIKKTSYYQCKYLAGAYPEGNPVYELFIHPVDNCIDLFGEAKIKLIKKISTGNEAAVYILILEQAHITGIIELSTGSNWQSSADNMVIHTSSETLTVQYPDFIEGEQNPVSLLGIPVEKIVNRPTIKKIYFNSNSAIPSLQNNSIYLQGFYGAINAFVTAVEKNVTNRQFHIERLRNTFAILNAINLTS